MTMNISFPFQKIDRIIVLDKRLLSEKKKKKKRLLSEQTIVNTVGTLDINKWLCLDGPCSGPQPKGSARVPGSVCGKAGQRRASL